MPEIPQPIQSRFKEIPIVCKFCNKHYDKHRVNKDCKNGFVMGVCNSKFCEKTKRWNKLGNEKRQAHVVLHGVGLLFIRDGILPSLSTFPVNGIKWQESTYICGPVGTGKTWALSAMICDAESHGYNSGLINWGWFRMEVRDSYNVNSASSERQLLEACVRCDVLCIDDLGVSKESPAATELLYLIIDKRYSKGLITHISSNIPPGEIKNVFNDRISRRILEMCKVVVLSEVI